MSGCTELSIHTNNHFEPDQLSATLAISADTGSLTTWTDADPAVLIEARAGFIDATGTMSVKQIFYGELDRPTVALIERTVTIEARDLSRRLADTKTRENFSNYTVSNLIKTLAGRVKLTADVDNFPQKVGAFYQVDHDKISQDSYSHTTNLRDLTIWLAQQVGADFWVSGQTLHFKSAVDATKTTPYSLVYTPPGADNPYPSLPATSIQLARDLTIAKDVVLSMRIWDSKQKQATVLYYPKSGQSAVENGTSQEYVLPPRPGMSPAAALVYMQSQYQAIVLHERLVAVVCPGELVLDARSVIKLSGTGTTFDQSYYVDSIDRTWSVDSGFDESIQLKNHSTESQQSL
ncbi:hypothetical protein ACELLULO517_15815 [Acidisoma cellulosilytica]|uniref:Uncharacterized protein n=1 Tax=Acidisoma cellulosilyticum TaxID=2802395 RepID=A0A964E4H9_9PROT|nr:hypothetical protein [Acidisoma cellulosilyticum]MCB8881715.1 hypothetical protein [Acidisoma cellulosilyticum]